MSPGPTQADYQESGLRTAIRDILDLSWDTRDETILAELRRLKALLDEARLSRKA